MLTRKIRLVVEVREGDSLSLVHGEWVNVPLTLPVTEAIKKAARGLAERQEVRPEPELVGRD